MAIYHIVMFAFKANVSPEDMKSVSTCSSPPVSEANGRSAGLTVYFIGMRCAARAWWEVYSPPNPNALCEDIGWWQGE